MSETKKQIAGFCPKCDSVMIEYGTGESTDYGVSYPAVCENCGTTFRECYTIEFLEQDKIGGEDE